MRIAEAAGLLGVAPHVLRHWDDADVVRPARSPQGYRVYDEETLARLRIVVQCQAAGMSLDQIRRVLRRGEPGRSAVLRSHHAVVVEQLTHLERTARFLDHVLTCRHSLMSRCPDCAAYAAHAEEDRDRRPGETTRGRHRRG